MASIYANSPAKRMRFSRLTTEEQIELLKEEIRVRMNGFRELIDAKERELLTEVDFLGDLQIIEKEELQLELSNLKEGKTAFEKSNRIAAVEDTVRSALRDLDLKIIDIQFRLEQYKVIKSSWEISQFQSSVNSLCSLSNVTNVDYVYQSKSAPKWRVGIGEGLSQLSSPTSLVIQQSTDNVYVSDKNGSKIQVYNSSGEHVRMIKKLKGSLNAFHIDNDSIFFVATKDSGKCITELNLETMNIRNIEFPEIFGRGSSIITAHPFKNSNWFYGCVFNFPLSPSKHTDSDSTGIVKFKDSKPVSDPTSSCTLHSISKPLPSHSDPIGIATDGKYIYILIRNNKYHPLILKYTSDCEFVRSFCPSSLVSGARSVCVDSRGNILVAGSEGDSTKLLCLSPDGDVIHEFLVPCQSCVSIAVNSKFDISLLCDATNHGLVTL